MIRPGTIDDIERVHALLNAAFTGFVITLTGNDSTNAGMLSINDRLGYRPVAQHLTWVKRLA